jgi:hypothetical protein
MFALLGSMLAITFGLLEESAKSGLLRMPNAMR